MYRRGARHKVQGARKYTRGRGARCKVKGERKNTKAEGFFSLSPET
jgi:hypothetical protein